VPARFLVHFRSRENTFASGPARLSFPIITRVQELWRHASTLSVAEKAALAADLLESLPPVLDDDDEGVAEARRRDEEMERDPNAAITWEQLRRGVGR
jgi:putative addiction module component (TIGR02574 family)